MNKARKSKRIPIANVVKNALREMEPSMRGKAGEAAFVHLAIQDHLLGKLGLENEQLQRAKQIEAHSTRLMQATARVSNGVPLTVKMAQDIIQRTKDLIPKIIMRKGSEISREELENMRELEKNLTADLKKMVLWDPNMLTSLSPQFLQTAANYNFSELEATLGKKKYEEYMEHQRRAQKLLALAAQKGII